MAGGHAKPPPASHRGSMVDGQKRRQEGTKKEPKAALAILALALCVAFLLSAAPATGAAGALPSARTSASPLTSPGAVASTNVWLNQSQTLLTGVAYVKEAWCELTSTLKCNGAAFDLPSELLVSSGSCLNVGWDVNASASVLPVSPFHAMQLMNVTAGNDSGTQTPVAVSSPSSVGPGVARYFQVCGGHAYFVNYVEFSYSIYAFFAPTLGQNASSVTASFGSWPGTSRAPANLTAPDFGGTGAVQFVIPDNLSVRFQLPLSVAVTDTASLQCQLGVCSTTTYTFTAAVKSALGTNGTGAIQYGTIGAAKGFALPGTAYSNWTASYTNATGTQTTGAGGFFLTGYNVAYAVFITYGVLTVILALILVAVAVAYRDTHRYRGSRRRSRR